jgi:hypothetical protein
VKQILSFSAFVLIVLVGFSSCKKDYTCYCYIDYKRTTDHISVYHTDNTFGIRSARKDDAEGQCKYYQTEEYYLNQHVFVDHNCSIVED